MTELRKQLSAARADYRRMTYAGDLAEILPAIQSTQSPWILSRIALIGGLAAAAALVIAVWGNGVADAVPTQWAMPIDLDARPLMNHASLSPALDMRTKSAMSSLGIAASVPRQLPDLLAQASKPLIESGHFIFSIGKDLAHHADALFHMG